MYVYKTASSFTNVGVDSLQAAVYVTYFTLI